MKGRHHFNTMDVKVFYEVEKKLGSNGWNRTYLSLCTSCRDSIGAQLQLALAKADSEQLARSIAEEQLSDVEKEKTMLELELKEALSRHRDELNKKDILVTTVRAFAFPSVTNKSPLALPNLCFCEVLLTLLSCNAKRAFLLPIVAGRQQQEILQRSR